MWHVSSRVEELEGGGRGGGIPTLEVLSQASFANSAQYVIARDNQAVSYLTASRATLAADLVHRAKEKNESNNQSGSDKERKSGSACVLAAHTDNTHDCTAIDAVEQGSG